MELGFLVLGILFGGVASWFIAKYRFQSEQRKKENDFNIAEERNKLLQDQLRDRDTEIDAQRMKSEDLGNKLVAKETAFVHLEEKLAEHKAEVEELNVKFTKEFENLANRIFDDKSKKFVEQNKTKLEDILNPLKENIKDFEKKVEDTHKDSIDRHAALRQQIIGLRQLNEQMSVEAKNLTNALKSDNKAQGNWGEMILESLLEKSGLTKGIEFTIQDSQTDDEGRRLQPDVVINLPENKKIVIDSKVSLSAYDKYSSEDDEEEQNRHFKNHVQSLRTHIKLLGEKNYHQLYGIASPDFVLLFVPIEPAFNLAVRHNPDLYTEALDKNIVIISTSTLLATLMTISSLWKQEYQNRNVMQIAKQSGALYDKFVGLVKDLEDIGKKIDGSQKSYDNAMNKLTTGSGNLVGRVEKIKKLGAKASKSLPEDMVARSEEGDQIEIQ